MTNEITKIKSEMLVKVMAINSSNAAFRDAIDHAVQLVGGSQIDIAVHRKMYGSGGDSRTLLASDLKLRNRIIVGVHKYFSNFLEDFEILIKVSIRDDSIATSDLTPTAYRKGAARLRSDFRQLGRNGIGLIRPVHHPELCREDGSALIIPVAEGIIWNEPPRVYRRPFCLSYAAMGNSSSVA